MRSQVHSRSRGGRGTDCRAPSCWAEAGSLSFLPLLHHRQPLPLDWSWYVSGNLSAIFGLCPYHWHFQGPLWKPRLEKTTTMSSKAALSCRGHGRWGSFTRKGLGLTLSHWPWGPQSCLSKIINTTHGGERGSGYYLQLNSWTPRCTGLKRAFQKGVNSWRSGFSFKLFGLFLLLF